MRDWGGVRRGEEEEGEEDGDREMSCGEQRTRNESMPSDIERGRERETTSTTNQHLDKRCSANDSCTDI
jgi:hypothetical protein